MKKRTILFTGMTISLLLGALFGQATFAEENAVSSSLVDLVLERHCSDVAEPLGEDCITNTFNNDAKELKKLAQSDEGPFHNLYLFTYQNVVEAPKQEALKQLAKIEQNYTQSDLEAILFEDDFTPITVDSKLNPDEVEAMEEELTRLEEEIASEAENLANDESGVSAEFLAFIGQSNYINAMRRRLEVNESIGTEYHLLNEVATLQDAYASELEFQMENRKLAYQSYATEVFFDNDLSNSANIDILHDLDLINYLLFGEFITYPDRSTASDEEVELSSETAITALFEPVQFTDEEVELSEESNTEINPYVCLEDESLRDALEAYASGPMSTSSTNNSSSNPSSSSGSTTETSDEATDDTVENIRQDFETFVTSLTAQEGDWTRTLPCGEIFCITVNLVKGTWGTTSGSQGEYEETDNCIACHLDYIAAATDETLSGGVQPNKVSQNWFEDGTCKVVGNGIDLDFHVYAIAQPIELDPGDDIDDDANESFVKTYQNILDWSYLNNVSALGLTPVEFEQEAYLNALNLAGSTMSIDQTLNALAEIEEAKTQELVEILTKQDIEVKVKSSYELYNQMENEFNSMLLYFLNYSDWLKETYMDEQAPLNEIIKKPYCP